MAWQDELQRVTLPDGRKLIGASFRGVAFFVDSSSRSGGGRRTVVHEFYGADEPEIGDAGRGAVDYQVTGYVLGADYIAHRDALIIALEGRAGPGELVHPFYGRKRAQCSSISVSESTATGGVATFSITFADAPDISAPTEIPDLGGTLDSAAAAALAANYVEMDAAYDVAGQPRFSTASLAAELDAIAQAMLDDLSVLAVLPQELALISSELNRISSNAATLIRTPSAMLDDLSTAISRLKTAISDNGLKLAKALLGTYLLDGQVVAIGTSATRDQERANQDAISSSLRRLLVIEAVRLLPRVDFASSNEADDIRIQALEALDELLLAAGNEAYPSLVLLRAAVVRAIPGDAVLARIQTVTKRTELPSLLLTYQLYGSVAKEQSVIDQNTLQHPSFMVGDLRVLSDV